MHGLQLYLSLNLYYRCYTYILSINIANVQHYWLQCSNGEVALT